MGLILSSVPELPWVAPVGEPPVPPRRRAEPGCPWFAVFKSVWSARRGRGLDAFRRFESELLEPAQTLLGDRRGGLGWGRGGDRRGGGLGLRRQRHVDPELTRAE